MPIIDSIMESMINESSFPKNLMNTSAKVDLSDCDDKTILKDKKFISAINSAYKKYGIEKELKKYAKQYNDDYSVYKNIYVDMIRIIGPTKNKSEKELVTVEVWFNSSENILAGHSYIITITVDINSYEVTSIKSSLEG